MFRVSRVRFRVRVSVLVLGLMSAVDMKYIQDCVCVCLCVCPDGNARTKRPLTWIFGMLVRLHYV